MCTVTIRRAGLEDAATLGKLHSLGWRAAYQGIMPDAFLAGFTPEKRAAFFTRILPATANEHYLLFRDDIPIGMLAIGPSDDPCPNEPPWGEVHALYLLPEAWGQGIGRKAMDFALRRLHALGYGDTTLTVLSDNHRALRFYRRYGFLADGAEEPFEVGGISLMERRYRLPKAMRDT